MIIIETWDFEFGICLPVDIKMRDEGLFEFGQKERNTFFIRAVLIAKAFFKLGFFTEFHHIENNAEKNDCNKKEGWRAEVNGKTKKPNAGCERMRIARVGKGAVRYEFDWWCRR